MRFETISLSDKMLEWHWAYRQQLKLLDSCDGQLLLSAETGWSDDDLKSFFFEYRLNRGKYHSAVRKNAKKIWKSLTRLFKKPVPAGNEIEELSKRWDKAVKIVGKNVPTRHSGVPAELWSMTSKLLWFHQPNFMTMYDQNARKGLQKITGKNILPKIFLREFDKFFNDNKSSIERAAQLSDRVYPFPRRIADAYLWLHGLPNEKRERILECFHEALRYAPLRRKIS